MAWRRLPGKRPGYTLVELLVVLFITVLLTGMGIPNLYAGDSRYLLNNEAQKIKQFLDDARIRSQAPTKNDGQGAQVYQISLGPFP
ncbi:MAG: prepilin-type N-terminal cleavage/methylation domain-containing protein, partial [Patescibacteria group bacterium]